MYKLMNFTVERARCQLVWTLWARHNVICITCVFINFLYEIYVMLLVLFPNQLFEVKIIKALKPTKIAVVDDPVFYGDRQGSPGTHAQKLDLNPMRLDYQRTSVNGYISYLSSHLSVPIEHITYDSLIVHPIETRYNFLKDSDIHVYDPMDALLMRRLEKAGIQPTVHDSPSFIMTGSDIDEYKQLIAGKKTLRHAHFFEFVKTKLGVLANIPNMDKQNRRPFPKDAEMPPPVPHNIPMTHAGAKQWYALFLRERFKLFGDFEDAVVDSRPYMYHSGISVFLNNGLLLPVDVIKQALVYAKKHHIPMHCVEGFVRQIIGWREFCRLYYVTVPHTVYRKNSLKATITRLDSRWYTGDTGVPIVDRAIVDAFKHGYLHHIRRLMVMANYMTLCKLHPDLVYKWMYEFSLDSWDWVMVFNCYSMGSYSDGGVATWKPYISSSAYLKRMAHEPSGNWENDWNTKYRALKNKA